jgi:hypothetical protein
MGKVVMEMWDPAPPAPMAKAKKRRGKNPDDLPMKNMESDPQRREVVTILFGPNRVANIPPMREKRR